MIDKTKKIVGEKNQSIEQLNKNMETLLKDNKTLLAAVTKYKNGLQQAKQLLEENQKAHEETLRELKS